MFGLSPELIIEGKLATVKRFESLYSGQFTFKLSTLLINQT